MPLHNSGAAVAETIEALTYDPVVQDSGDMEAATKTISATSEPGAADYSVSLTIAAPSDARVIVNRLGVLLGLEIDSWGGGGTTLNYRIKRAGVSIGTGTVTVIGAIGAQIVTADATAGTLTGAATYELLFWVDAGSCVLSMAELWVGVGTTANDTPVPILSVSQAGYVSLAGEMLAFMGSQASLALWPNLDGTDPQSLYLDGTDAYQQYLYHEANHNYVPAGAAWGACKEVYASDDIIYVNSFRALLRTVS